MNWLDIVIIFVVLIYALLGWRSGFVLLLLSLLGFGAALVVALLLYRYAALLFRPLGLVHGLAGVLGFLLVFLIVDALFWFLLARAYRGIPREVRQSPPNRVFGLFLGAAKGVLVCAIAILILIALPIGLTHNAVARSAIGAPLLRVGSEVERAATFIFPSDIRDSLTFLTIRPESGESVSIPRATDISIDRTAEQEMLRLVNRERTARGLRPLTMDPEIQDVARTHSRDMFNRGYFAHVSPTGEDPFDRMRQGGIRFRTAGENLALAPTVRIAHDGLMQSPGHRANILNPAYGRIGVGAYESNRHGKMFTQNFAN